MRGGTIWLLQQELFVIDSGHYWAMDRERQGEAWEAARKTDSKEATSCLPADATDRPRNSLTGVSQRGTWSPEADPSVQLEVSPVRFPLRMKSLVNANHRGLGFLEPGRPVVER